MCILSFTVPIIFEYWQKITYLSCLQFPIHQQKGQIHTYPPQKNEKKYSFKPFFFFLQKKSTFYDILYSMKIEVDTIQQHNQKTIPVVRSSVFLAPILCV